jgi:hypothetical protein
MNRGSSQTQISVTCLFVVQSLLLFCCGEAGVTTNGSDNFAVSSDRLDAARVAVFVLRATRPADIQAQPDVFVDLPSHQELNESAMIRILASREKPLRCSCVLESGSLMIRCERADDREGLTSSRGSGDLRLHGLRPLTTRERPKSLGDQTRILLRAGDHQSLVTTLATLQQFQRDYSIAHASALDEPTTAEMSAGISVVYRIWPSTGWILEGPNLRIEGR